MFHKQLKANLRLIIWNVKDEGLATKDDDKTVEKKYAESFGAKIIRRENLKLKD